MSLKQLRYKAQSFSLLFAVAVGAQIRARKFHAFLVLGSHCCGTVTGTAMAEVADRSLHIYRPGGSSDFVCAGDWRSDDCGG